MATDWIGPSHGSEDMTKATERIMQGFLLLAVVFVTAVVGYHYFHDLNWLEASWLAVAGITGTGFGEESTKPPSFQLLTIFVMVFGFFSTAYAFTGLVQLLLAGELERYLGRKRMEREISKLVDHVIVCGFGRLGQSLIVDLASEQHSLVVVEADQAKAQLAETEGHLVLQGDATEEDILTAAGIGQAKSLVTTLPSDAANVFIALSAREMNKDLQIIARAESPTTERKLQHAGASKVVMPAATSARHMVRMITRPSTAHLIDLMAERTFQDLEMDELLIVSSSKLVGKTVGDSELNYRHKLLVVAVKQSDETMVFNPGGSYEFCANDIAIVMGKRRDIDGFCELHRLRA